jgi:chromosome segregation protein
MLARLELVGFKSFAERTRFDFAPGVTAVVGPNGSGKSNIVDAVRWVLGEQSAKSLRGGEMADVIFNGSSTRKSVGLAEVSATFDNRTRVLAFDGDDVTITRRVYRDGQGEYLINGEASRLKDIRELLLGSGAGQGAYSIIEQGRVDALLTTSTKDRRIVFEEAAGISRFKAKKLETLRKLDNVDGDLTRIKDIVAELDKQLRTLQLQAAKAAKYREYSERLKALRIGLAVRDFAAVGESLTAESANFESARNEAAAAKQRVKAGEQALRKAEWDIGRCDDGLRHQAARLSDARQQLAGHDATAKAERTQAANVESDLLRLGRQRAEAVLRIRELESDRERLAGELASIAADERTASERSTLAESRLADAATALAELVKSIQSDREAQFDAVDRLARLQSVVDSSASLLERHRKELARKQVEAEQLSGRHDAVERALAELSQSDFDLRGRLEEAKAEQAAATATRDRLRYEAERLDSPLDDWRNRRSDLAARIELLDRLEQSYDGLGQGVRQIAEWSRNRADSPILGMVAELLTVPREWAPLIDIALGESARDFVVPDAESADRLIRELPELAGRVGLLPLVAPERRPLSDGPPPLDCLAATGLVTSPIPGLVERLLGNVAIVERRRPPVAGVRLVTRTGELIEPDGRTVVGPAEASAGLVSRKAELRELRSEANDTEAAIAAIEAERSRLFAEADALAPAIRDRDAEIATLSGEAGTLREQIIRQRDQQALLADRIELLVREADILALEVKHAEQTWADFRGQAEGAETLAKTIQRRMAESDAAIVAAEAERTTAQAAQAEARIALSQIRERLTAIRTRRDEIERALDQRRLDEATFAAEVKAANARMTAGMLLALRATADAADAYRIKDERERTIAELANRRAGFAADADRLREALEADRQALQDRQSAAHGREMTVQSLAARRESLAARIRDDYGIELSLAVLPDDIPESAGEEIDQLKSKIAKLGSVNLEALDELTDVERRAAELKSQFADLVDAKKKLVEIIDQINGDSRRLFTETLGKVRTHFQELFRKLFGGGMADIVLEDDADVLESGIEIQARPPGKELRSIALMSGGEKTMTAVALLLAIFRNRPSPFCLLDEVDAALDEANTSRFAGVIREFLDRSQFIVITHKKRTMAAADVLYGVTMQESGVSKQVAVRFEDWPDDVAEPQATAA